MESEGIKSVFSNFEWANHFKQELRPKQNKQIARVSRVMRVLYNLS